MMDAMEENQYLLSNICITLTSLMSLAQLIKVLDMIMEWDVRHQEFVKPVSLINHALYQIRIQFTVLKNMAIFQEVNKL
jgi:hypothetical protein